MKNLPIHRNLQPAAACRSNARSKEVEFVREFLDLAIRCSGPQ